MNPVAEHTAQAAHKYNDHQNQNESQEPEVVLCNAADRYTPGSARQVVECDKVQTAETQRQRHKECKVKRCEQTRIMRFVTAFSVSFAAVPQDLRCWDELGQDESQANAHKCQRNHAQLWADLKTECFFFRKFHKRFP